ncbi:hypothetical protein HF673_07795 [Acidithiobacillus thiooxidans]|uniref:hypothetical protein n=1 Tax=Acidithiobacillus thiooxidans TaxID=930 RepID=UPI001C06585F|nr:hypothetical protein [Acidithiobacillus thiooxidans]MBU2835667.1 hypothetical protein [Acidithiobacillus thiooxidans]
MDADSTHKTPHCVRKKTPPNRNHWVSVQVSDAAWQALQAAGLATVEHPLWDRSE